MISPASMWNCRCAVAIVHLARPAKRNALNDETVASCLERWFSRPPEQVKAVAPVGDGDHFCAGLDLLEPARARRRRRRAPVFALVACAPSSQTEFGTLPVVAVLTGPSSAVDSNWPRPRVSASRKPPPSTRFREGSRGIYVGGGASVRVPKLPSASRA